MQSYIDIRLKVKELEKIAKVDSNERIGTFKTREFPQNRARVIWRGKELSDSETFSGVCVSNNDVIHVILLPRVVAVDHSISEEVHAPSPSGIRGQDMLLLCLCMISMLCWMIACSLPELFSFSSTIMLSGLTAVLVIFCVAKISTT
jgi:hypothetical protein